MTILHSTLSPEASSIRLSVTAGEKCCRDCGYRCARPDLQDYLWRCQNYVCQRSDKKRRGTLRISLGEYTLRPIDDWRTKDRAIMARPTDGIEPPTAERDAQKTSSKYLSKQCNCSYKLRRLQLLVIFSDKNIRFFTAAHNS